MHSRKIQLLENFNEDDNECRLQFCKIMFEIIMNNPNYLFQPIFIFSQWHRQGHYSRY